MIWDLLHSQMTPPSTANINSNSASISSSSSAVRLPTVTQLQAQATASATTRTAQPSTSPPHVQDYNPAILHHLPGPSTPTTAINSSQLSSYIHLNISPEHLSNFHQHHINPPPPPDARNHHIDIDHPSSVAPFHRPHHTDIVIDNNEPRRDRLDPSSANSSNSAANTAVATSVRNTAMIGPTASFYDPDQILSPETLDYQQQYIQFQQAHAQAQQQQQQHQHHHNQHHHHPLSNQPHGASAADYTAMFPNHDGQFHFDVGQGGFQTHVVGGGGHGGEGYVGANSANGA